MSVAHQVILAALLIVLVAVLGVLLASAHQIDAERRGDRKRREVEIDDPDLYSMTGKR